MRKDIVNGVRNWLIQKGWVGDDGHISDAYMEVVDKTIDLAVGELLGEPTFDDMFWVIEPDKGCRNLDAATYGKCCQVLASRRSHYLKPKSAEEKLRDEIYTILRKWQTVDDPYNCNEESAEKVTERIVTAVRKVDAK